MNKPSYTNHPIYQILEEIAHKAGIKIDYVKLADRVFGECLDYNRTILMSDINIYINDKDEDGGSNASFYLAHEMAHALIDNMYSYNKYDYEHDTATYKFIDADDDKVGGALYHLALMIYEQNEMEKFN